MGDLTSWSTYSCTGNRLLLYQHTPGRQTGRSWFASTPYSDDDSRWSPGPIRSFTSCAQLAFQLSTYPLKVRSHSRVGQHTKSWLSLAPNKT